MYVVFLRLLRLKWAPWASELRPSVVFQYSVEYPDDSPGVHLSQGQPDICAVHRGSHFAHVSPKR